MRLLNEATAALLSYGKIPRNREREQNVLVFDLGGGTLDICVATLGEGIYEVKCVEGDSNLGGDDFTQVIEDYPDYTKGPCVLVLQKILRLIRSMWYGESPKAPSCQLFWLLHTGRIQPNGQVIS